MTFNVLAPCYKHLMIGNTDKLESTEPALYLARNRVIVDSIQEVDTDIVCLQEFWFRPELKEFYESALKHRWATPVYMQRARQKPDGLVTLFGTKWQFVDSCGLLDDRVGDRVALLLRLSSVAILGESSAPITIILVNVHLTFPHHDYDETVLRPRQINEITTGIDTYISRHGLEESTVFICGDFNSPHGKQDLVTVHVEAAGYQCSFQSLYKRYPGATHRNHLGQKVSVDYIFFRTGKQPGLKVTPVDSYLFPRETRDAEWPENFLCSDHRPLVSKFCISTLF